MVRQKFPVPNPPSWFGRLELGEKRSLFPVCLRAATLYLFGALGLLFFVTGPPGYAQQVTLVPPFIGTHSETWERFGVRGIPSGTSILGGIATISGDHMVTERQFQMCAVTGIPSDGHILMDSDRPSGPLTISFSQPVSAFGAYWGSGYGCYGNPSSILTFRDAAGNTIGTESFTYRGDGHLMWRGYRFGTPVKTITRRAGDGLEGVAIDGLQATVAGAPTPTPTPRAAVADFNGDGHPDLVIQNAATHQTVIGYLNNNVVVGAAYGPTLPAGWRLQAVADFNRDSYPDYALFIPTTEQTILGYLSGPTIIGAAYGPALPGSWELVATADFNGDGNSDYVLYKANTQQTAIYYLDNNIFIGWGPGPTLPTNWNLIGAADFNRDAHTDYGLFNPTTGQTLIGYLSGLTAIGAAYGPTIPSGWALVATADFNADGDPDYVLYKASSRQTAIYYLNNNIFVGWASGPTLPIGWSVVAP
jgi:hypothetical protein